MSALPPISRPNGKLYRPRKLTAQMLGDGDEDTGVVVFGTHDIAEARRAAGVEVARFNADTYAPEQGVAVHIITEGERVWWAQKLAHFDEGSPWYTFSTDEEHGRAGVEFDIQYIDERFGDKP